jgi:hypothetical protein
MANTLPSAIVGCISVAIRDPTSLLGHGGRDKHCGQIPRLAQYSLTTPDLSGSGNIISMDENA